MTAKYFIFCYDKDARSWMDSCEDNTNHLISVSFARPSLAGTEKELESTSNGNEGVWASCETL